MDLRLMQQDHLQGGSQLLARHQAILISVKLKLGKLQAIYCKDSLERVLDILNVIPNWRDQDKSFIIFRTLVDAIYFPKEKCVFNPFRKIH